MKTSIYNNTFTYVASLQRAVENDAQLGPNFLNLNIGNGSTTLNFDDAYDSADESYLINTLLPSHNDSMDIIGVLEKMIDYQIILGLEVIKGLKIRNRLQGITSEQSAHYIITTREPLDMLREGLLESARDASLALIPDDMTMSKHFLTMMRRDMVVDDIDAALLAAQTKLLELMT